MTAEYHSRFAEYYDVLYGDRDVAGECRLVTRKLNGDEPAGRRFRLLDFGCGTGSHALHLAAQGWEVLGFDRSADMIRRARDKRRGAPGRIDFISGEARMLQQRCGDAYFDGAISLFNVFNCMPTDAVMLEHLRTIHRLVRSRGRFVLDLWNGAAVLGDRPRVKTRQAALPGEPHCRVTQTLRPTVDRSHHTCTLRYTIEVDDLRCGRRSTFEESQVVHFLAPAAYRRLFESAGFAVVEEFPVGRPATELTAEHWFATYVLARG